jgi:hypothetical protein
LLLAFDGIKRIYTDGSKHEAVVAMVAVMNSMVLVKRVPDLSPMFSVDAQAILLALGATERSVS